VKCPRCHRDSKEGALYCPGCGAPLALGREPVGLPLDASVSLDRRTVPRLAEPEPELARTEVDLAAHLARPFELAPPRGAPVAAPRVPPPEPAPEAAESSRSHWDLGVALPADASRTFAPVAPLDAAGASGPSGALDLHGRGEEPCSGLAVPEPEVDALEIHLRRAGSWRRALAWALDAVPFAALLVYALRALHAGEGVSSDWGSLARAASDTAVALPVAAGIAILLLVYHTLCHALAGATLGKRLLGLRVAGPDGRRPSLARSAARAALSAVSVAALGLGLLLALFTLSGRALHDLLAGTWVVEAP
jgi:resuscitation-promoting factor RpfA